ncbi:MAG: hypothetical protein ABIO70_05195 [Pseudomonadota bacterium]
MSPRALLPALAAVLAAGCWPWIPGTYDDYVTPKATRIFGHASYDEYLGGYWDPGQEGGQIWWGWTAEAERQLHALDFAAPAGVGECDLTEVSFDDFASIFADPGATSATLSGPEGEITLPWSPQAGVFTSSVGALPIGKYSLDALPTNDAGNIKVHTFMRVPKPADIDGISLDDDSFPTITLADLDFAWNQAEELAQYVIITATLVDANHNPLESAVCAAKFSNGDINFSTGLWTRAGEARGVQIIFSTANEQWVEIGDRGISSRMLSERRQIGYAALQ